MEIDEKPIPQKDEEEIVLEKLVFGDEAGFDANLRKIENLYDYSDEERELYADSDDDDDDEEEKDEYSDLFFIDESGDSEKAHVDAMDVDLVDPHVRTAEDRCDQQAAWYDSDDNNVVVALDSIRSKSLRVAPVETALSGAIYIARLRSQYEKIYPRPEWAEKLASAENCANFPDFADESDEDAAVGTNTATLTALLQSTTTFARNSSVLLPPGTLSILRLKDANIVRRARSGIQSIAFHPLHALLLSGGFDRTLRMYHIDGKTNRFVSLVHFRDMPITTCLFVAGSNSTLVYAAGRRKYMHRWDISTGEIAKISRMYGQDKVQKSYEYFRISPKGTTIALKGTSGWVNLVSGDTGQFVKGFKVEGHVADFFYSEDESVLIISNHSGTICEFDTASASNNTTCKWTDLSAVAVTKIAMGGPGDRWLAIGTKSGVVNLYDRLKCYESENADGASPKPFKEVGNLVTEITDLQFSPDGQILCILSLQKKDALRMVHLPLGTVFSNWPTSGTPLGRVTTTRFSPDNQMLAIGNDTGKITLWRLDHY